MLSFKRLLLALIVFTVLFCTCNGNIFDYWFGSSNEKRSLTEAITDYLDLVYPKDDRETKVMKNILMTLSDEGNGDLESHLGGMHYLLE